jgi:CHAT domain-containing protein|tara:strand:+ start:908 stop:1069 length:162 start_codon:yes stop_codon:yes gene_type:complete
MHTHMHTHNAHALRMGSQAEALRAAMLAVRKARSWEPPLFWAGYTLLGVSNGI